ncbi:MAG: FAD-dependent oxidoreductase [Ruminococcaceae bacterium]|nr:FAD-dependent oxidoreductase [Oscillospiraceae bacterium]
MKSLWIDTVQKFEFKELNGDINTDVLIVGGGLTGILCAYMLQKSGVDYTLIEANKICSGITKNTTAKVTVQHGLIYDKIINKYGIKTAKKYYNANNNALNIYRELCKELNCNFENKDAFVYTTNKITKIKDEINAYKSIGVSTYFTTKTTLPFKVSGAVKIKNQGQINPLEFLYKISKNVNIKENTKLINLEPQCAETNKCKISFKKAIIATHFPILNKHGSYFLKMYQHRSYVIALENAQNVEGMYIDDNIKGLSFRNYGDLLLLGGGSHRTGKSGGNWAELEAFARKYYPNSKIKYKWATQDCMTLDGLPYIGNYSKNTPNLFVATGYNKWGFTSAMVAAEILCDLVQEKHNEYASVFSPSRSILHPQLAINGVEAFLNIITPTTPRCPHLGCALKYNKYEHTWDCPCHGSRFETNGKLIDGPATDDKIIQKK